MLPERAHRNAGSGVVLPRLASYALIWHQRAVAARTCFCIGAPALPRRARRPPFFRCCTPIAYRHRSGPPFHLARRLAKPPSGMTGGGVAVRAYWFGLHAPPLAGGELSPWVRMQIHAYGILGSTPFSFDSLERNLARTSRETPSVTIGLAGKDA